MRRQRWRGSGRSSCGLTTGGPGRHMQGPRREGEAQEETARPLPWPQASLCHWGSRRLWLVPSDMVHSLRGSVRGWTPCQCHLRPGQIGLQQGLVCSGPRGPGEVALGACPHLTLLEVSVPAVTVNELSLFCPGERSVTWHGSVLSALAAYCAGPRPPGPGLRALTSTETLRAGSLGCCSGPTLAGSTERHSWVSSRQQPESCAPWSWLHGQSADLKGLCRLPGGFGLLSSRQKFQGPLSDPGMVAHVCNVSGLGG